MSKQENPKRDPIPKRVRFEVFKRDSFGCQYCGRKAPEVLLHIDHMTPIADGGTNDIANLITSCAACNLGKGKTPLAKHSLVERSRKQMEELEERRQQLEFLMDWHRSLKSFDKTGVDVLIEYWQELTPGRVVNEHGRKALPKWLRRFDHQEILYAMDIASEQYIEISAGGNVTKSSWERAWSKIPGICRVRRESKEDPSIQELYYIRGIARNQCPHYFDNARAMNLIRSAHDDGVSLTDLREAAKSASGWTSFQNRIASL